MMTPRCIGLFVISIAALCGCNKKERPFQLLSSRDTNVTFNNLITESDTLNVLAFEYIYNGSGVGVGDFNNDGLSDIFFGGNMVSSRLYLNKGDFKFEDVTAKAGLTTNFWATGVSVVDINNDGFDDIYVCASGKKDPSQRTNKLYINNGFSPSPSGESRGEVAFTEEAEQYGLADTSYSTQAVFFDYDKDGDLDMYLMNHLLYNLNANTVVSPNDSVHDAATDKLYRNEGTPKGMNHPVFKDVSKEAGIKDFGYGLGIVVSDFNNDNYFCFLLV